MSKTSSIMYHPYCSAGVARKLKLATGLSPKEALLKLLEEEQTIKAISQRTEINRTQIYQALAYFGIAKPSYNQSEFMRQWYKDQPPGTSNRLTKKANEASRGVKKSHKHLAKIAIGKQKKPRISKGERRVIDLLRQHSIDHVPQFAIDIFNIDVALPALKIAIEVNGGQWHHLPVKQLEDERKRTYLESKGWTVIYLWGSPSKIEQAASDLMPKLKQLERDRQL